MYIILHRNRNNSCIEKTTSPTLLPTLMQANTFVVLWKSQCITGIQFHALILNFLAGLLPRLIVDKNIWYSTVITLLWLWHDWGAAIACGNQKQSSCFPLSLESCHCTVKTLKLVIQWWTIYLHFLSMQNGIVGNRFIFLDSHSTNLW